MTMPTYMTNSTGLTATLAGAMNWLARFPMSVITLMMRLAVGGVFFKSGLVKIQSWDTTVMLFAEEYKVPLLPHDVAAYLGTAAELSCPVMIVAGLFARLGAAALLGMTLVIQIFVYPENWAEHLMWAAILLYIVTRGPGTISIDAQVASRVYSTR